MPETDTPFIAGEEASRVSALEQFQRDLSERGIKNWGKITDSAVAYAQQSVTDTMHAQKERVLERAQDLIKDALEGKRYAGQAEFVAEMRKVLGFPTSGNFGEKGNLNNLAGDRRLRMIYDMQMTRAHAEIKAQEDKESGADVLFPAQELVRGASVKEPRDWIARWQEAGGTFYEGRMMALKDDGIWTRISAFGEPYPPFDYNSQMVVRDVSIREAIDAGLLPESALEDALKDYERINADEEPEPEPQETPQELVEHAETTEKATSAEWSVEERINAERRRFIEENAGKFTQSNYAELLETAHARYVFEHIGAEGLEVYEGRIALRAGVRDDTVSFGKKINPHRGDPAFKNNCTTCASATSARVRGLPAQAITWRELNMSEAMADKLRGGMPEFLDGSWRKKYPPFSGSAKNLYFNAKTICASESECANFTQFIAKNHLPDGRYNMETIWSKRFGGHAHITTFTIKNGKATFYEPQTGEIMKHKDNPDWLPYRGQLARTWCRLKINPIKIFRVDNRPMDLELLAYATRIVS